MRRLSLPFRNLPPAAWQNLAIASLITFYLVQVTLDVVWGNTFGNLGSDFAAFWSAGHIANTLGYRFVYDLEAMQQVQRDLVPISAQMLVSSRTIPAPFLPAFILPFQMLALLRPPLSFAAWSLINLAGTILYLRRFMLRLAGAVVEGRLLLLCMASAPVFLNVFLGQANLWLMVCVGESLLATIAGRPARSGAWLAGLLLKPQLLVLIVPALLVRREFRALAGLGLIAGALIGGSWLLSGSDALSALAGLWLGYAGGLPSNDIQLMMNWRMLAMEAASLLGELPALIILIAGSVITSLLAIAIWARQGGMTPPRFAVASIAIWAATASVAWHSHVHMAVVLIPPLLMLAIHREDIGPGILTKWALIPAAALAARIILAALLRLGGYPPHSYSWIDSVGAVAQLGANIWLLVVAARLSAASGALRPRSHAAQAA